MSDQKFAEPANAGDRKFTTNDKPSVMKQSTVLFCGAIAIAALNASECKAASASIPFNGSVNASCALTVGTPGVLAPNATFTSLSSTNAGGTPGTVTVTSTGTSFTVIATAPTSFNLAPTTGGDNVNFASTYSGTGATQIAATSGTLQTAVNIGTTNLTVNLNAAKSAGLFAGGAYSAGVTVTCE